MADQSDLKLRSLDVSISEDDIYAAMKEIPGYLDITPGDFKELYAHAYQHALNKIAGSITAVQIMNRMVVSCNHNTPLDEVARLLEEHDISGAPVTDDTGTVVGVISKKDFMYCIAGKDTRSFLGIILKFIENQKCALQAIAGKKAEDIMSSPAIIVPETAPVVDIMNLFMKHSINRVPVVDNAGRVCGIITRADLLKVPVALSC